MINRQIVTSATLAFILSGCAMLSSRVEIPKWYLKLPVKKGYVYAVGTEKGDKIENAVSEATKVAAEKLGSQMEMEIEANAKRAQEEVNDIAAVNSFNTTFKTIMAKSLSDWTVHKQDIVPAGKQDGKSMYQAFVVIEWNETAAQERVLEQLKADEKLYQQFRSTELLNDLEKDVAEYRKRRGY